MLNMQLEQNKKHARIISYILVYMIIIVIYNKWLWIHTGWSQVPLEKNSSFGNVLILWAPPQLRAYSFALLSPSKVSLVMLVHSEVSVSLLSDKLGSTFALPLGIPKKLFTTLLSKEYLRSPVSVRISNTLAQ